MLEDCQAPILVTKEGLDSRLKVKQPINVVHMDRGWHNKLRSSRKALEPVSPDSLAYIMYTSGYGLPHLSGIWYPVSHQLSRFSKWRL